MNEKADYTAAPPEAAHEEVRRILDKPGPALPDAIEENLKEVVEDIAQRENAPGLVGLLWPNA